MGEKDVIVPQGERAMTLQLREERTTLKDDSKNKISEYSSTINRKEIKSCDYFPSLNISSHTDVVSLWNCFQYTHKSLARPSLPRVTRRRT